MALVLIAVICIVFFLVKTLEHPKVKSKTMSSWEIHGKGVDDFEVSFASSLIKIVSTRNNKKVINLTKVLEAGAITNAKHIEVKCSYRTRNIKKGEGWAFFGCDFSHRSKVDWNRKKIDTLKNSNEWTDAILEIDASDQPYNEIHITIGLFESGEIEFREISIKGDGVNFGSLIEKEPSDEDISSLKNSVTALDILASGNDTATAVLKKIVADADIVGFGESTHGTHEFFIDRLGMLKKLVNMDFTILCMESDMSASEIINDYIHGRNANIDHVFTTLPDFMKTKEMVKTLEWIKSYNKDNDNKVSVYGLDIKGIDICTHNLLKFGEQYSDSTIVRLSKELQKSVDKLQLEYMNHEEDIRSVNTEHFKRVYDIASELLSYCRREREVLSTKSTPEAYEWMMQYGSLLTQFGDSFEHLSDLSVFNEKRDSSMYINTKWVRSRYSDAKLVLWLHNGHIQKAGKKLGNYLKHELGSKYVAIGYATYSGHYSAQDKNKIVANNKLQEAGRGSYEYCFHKTGVPNFLIDLRSLEYPKTNACLDSIMMFRNIGAFHEDQQFYPTFIRNNFDVVRYIESTTSSHLLKKRND